MKLRHLVAAAAVVPLLALATGCASPQAAPDATPTETASEPAAPALEGTVVVYAAASLKAAFDELAETFAQQNPGVTIPPIVYDGSSTLATQIIGGAQVDVFASADENNMKKVTDAGLLTGPQLFATNTLVVATPAGNPAGVTTLADLAKPDVTVVLCAAEVPCGAAAQTLLGNAGVSVTPASFEQNVTAVLTKVAADEADAGLVYKTDVAGRTDVESFTPDGAADVVNKYPIGVLSASSGNDAAAAFVAFVLGADGQKVLADHGFGAP